jgi:peptidoglycan/xylan/chitin deacetylase (PgdA/CDA1 family)
LIGPLPNVWMYHYVHDAGSRPVTGYPALGLAEFRLQLDDLCRIGTPVGWNELREAIAGRKPLPPDACMLTFDDGLMDHHRNVLPELEARNLPGIFFALARAPRDGLALGHQLHVLLGVMPATELAAAVEDRLPAAAASAYRKLIDVEISRAGAAGDVHDVADPWKRPLQRELATAAAPVLSALVDENVGTEADVAGELYLGQRELADLAAAGHTIGGHGRDHPWLDAVDPSARRRELAASAHLIGAYESGPWPFAYPYGGVPPRPRALLERAGFSAAFTTAAKRRDPFRLGRHDGDAITPAQLRALAD